MTAATASSRTRGPKRPLERLRGGYDALTGPAGNPWSQTTERRLLIGAVVVLIVTRALFIVLNGNLTYVTVSDEYGYLQVARDFSTWWSDGNAVRGPGYPALLAFFGLPRPMQVLQVALEAGMLVAVVRVVRGRWGQVAAATVAVLWLCYAPFAYHDILMTPDTIGVALVLAFGLCLLALWDGSPPNPVPLAAAAGAICGLEELLRPAAGRALFPALVVVLVIRYRRDRRALLGAGAATAVAFLVVVSPWLARNVAIYDKPLFTTSRAYGSLRGIPPDKLVGGGVVPFSALGYDYPRPPYNNSERRMFFDQDDVKWAEVDRQVLNKFIKQDAKHYIGTMASEHLRRPVNLWFGSSLAPKELAGYRYLRGDRFLGVYHVFHDAIVVLAVLALLALPVLRRRTFPWVFICVWTTAVVVAMVLPQARYALPYMPFLIVWAGIAIAAAIVSSVAARDEQQRPAGG
jgi:hypothetical protein